MILTVPSNRYQWQPRQAGRGKNTVSSGFEGPWTRGSEQHRKFFQSAGSPSCIDGRRSEKLDVGRQEGTVGVSALHRSLVFCYS